MKLVDLLEAYLRQRILRPDSQRTYRYCVDSVCKHYGGDPELSALTEDWWIGYRTAQLRQASPTTFNAKRRHLMCLINFAMARRLTDRNELRLIGRAPTATLPRKVVPDDTLKAALDVLRTVRSAPALPVQLAPRWFWITVVNTLYYTGMRRRQLVELRWDDVDLDARTIRLRAESSKTRREWLIPIADALIPELVGLSHRTLGATCREAHDPLSQVFNLPLFSEQRFGSQRLTVDYLSHWFLKLQSSLPRDRRAISAHRMRHTAATKLVRVGDANIKSVQTMLGHTTIQTTLGYVEVDVEDMRKSVDKIPRIG